VKAAFLITFAWAFFLAQMHHHVKGEAAPEEKEAKPKRKK